MPYLSIDFSLKILFPHQFVYFYNISTMFLYIFHNCVLFFLFFSFPISCYFLHVPKEEGENRILNFPPLLSIYFFHFYGTVTIFLLSSDIWHISLSKYLYSADLFPDRFHFTDFNLRFCITVQTEDPLSAAIVKQSGSCIFSII